MTWATWVARARVLAACLTSAAVASTGAPDVARAMTSYTAAWADVGFAIAECRLGSGVCFGEGTPVQTAEGLRPIESIEAGDLVWAMDPETGEEDWREVLETFVHPDAVLELAIERTSTSTGRREREDSRTSARFVVRKFTPFDRPIRSPVRVSGLTATSVPSGTSR